MAKSKKSQKKNATSTSTLNVSAPKTSIPTAGSSSKSPSGPPTTPPNKSTTKLPWAETSMPTRDLLSQATMTLEMLKVMDPVEASHVLSAKTAPEQPGVEEKTEMQRQSDLLRTAFDSIKRSERLLEAQLATVTGQIGILAQKWDEGNIPISRIRYQEQRAKNLALQQELMSRLSLLWSNSAAFAGCWAADMITDGVTRDVIQDWALIDDVLRLYPNIDGARKTVRPTRTEAQQSLFRKKLEARYDSGPTKEFNISYCCITGRRTQNVVAAHIVNVNVGAKTASALFGDKEDHIWSPRNGLLICKGYESLLDAGKAIILPADHLAKDAPPNAFVFHLLTRDIGPAENEIWGYDVLHGRQLQFPTHYRPSRRYLFFKATVTLLRRRRAEVDGHWADLSELPGIGRTMWATPGPYLKNSILYRFAREVGCLTRPEADLFWGIDTVAAFKNLNLSYNDKITSSKLAVQSSVATILEETTKEKGKEATAVHHELNVDDTDEPFLD